MKTGILLIDDDDNLRGAMVRALGEEGFKVDVASSVDEGLHLLNTVPKPQVVILDLHFPGPNGRVFLEKLESRSKGLRVIVHTGHNDLLPADKAGKLNVFTYLNKSDALNKGDAISTEALGASVQQLKFAINHAFEDIEAEKLKGRMQDYLRLQHMINARRSGDDVLEELCKIALEHVQGYTCHIRRLDGRKGDYELVAYAGPPRVRRLFSRNKKLSEWFSGEVARTGESRLYQDLQSEPEFVDFKNDLKGRVSWAEREYLDAVRAAYILPIKTNLFDEKHPVEAILNISGTEIDFFTPERKQLIEELLGFAQFAVSKQWLQHKQADILKDYQESNELLVKVSETLQHADNEIVETVLKGVSDIIRPEMISLFLYNEGSERVEKRGEYVGNRISFDGKESYTVGQCLTGNVFRQGEALLINDSPTKHRLYDTSRDEIDRLIVPSKMIEHYLAVPLKAGDKVIGVIRSVNKKSSYYDEKFPHVANNGHCLLPRGFSSDCEVIMGIIASHLAVTINNSRLIGKLNKKIEQLDSLSDVGHRISANYGLEAENLLELIVKETAEVMNSAICMLFLKNEEGDRVVLKQCYGIPLIPDAYYKLGHRNTGRVAKTGKPFKDKVRKLVGKYDTEVLELLKAKEGPDTKLTSFMIAPIIIDNDSSSPENNIIGVVKVINKRPAHRLFDDEDLSLFQSFASQISVALAMSEQNKSTFKLVHSVGHEIANTVSMISPQAEVFTPVLEGLVDDLEKAGALDEGQREKFREVMMIIGEIHHAAARAKDFAFDLLGFSESRFSERKPRDLNFLEDEVLKFREQPPPSVKNANEVELQFRLSQKPLVCDISESPFIHALLNIVANAYQAMEGKAKGKLVITTSEQKNKHKGKGKIARIEISDNGKGIPRPIIHKIFEADYSGRKGGNGLGLWLARMSLLRMKGRLSVKSEVNRGTTLILELPLSDS